MKKKSRVDFHIPFPLHVSIHFLTRNVMLAELCQNRLQQIAFGYKGLHWMEIWLMTKWNFHRPKSVFNVENINGVSDVFFRYLRKKGWTQLITGSEIVWICKKRNLKISLQVLELFLTNQQTAEFETGFKWFHWKFHLHKRNFPRKNPQRAFSKISHFALKKAFKGFSLNDRSFN